MSVVLDANVLIAATVTDHVRHDVVESWFSRRSELFATCPVIQGALVRLLPEASSGGGGGKTRIAGVVPVRHRAAGPPRTLPKPGRGAGHGNTHRDQGNRHGVPSPVVRGGLPAGGRCTAARDRCQGVRRRHP